MPKFTFDPLSVVSWPDEEYFTDTILENNEMYTLYPVLPEYLTPVIECENKPRDLFVYGINWKPAARIGK